MTYHKTIGVILFLLMAGIASGQPVSVTKSDVRITENGVTFFVHTVAAGQTLFSIAKAYEVDQAEIISLNPSAANGLQTGQSLKIPDVSAGTISETPKQQNQYDPGTPGGAGNFLIHTVMQGETLFGIARKYGVAVQEIIRSNPEVSDFENLSIGQELQIPVSKLLGDALSVKHVGKDSVFMHTVQRGESLYGIAQQYKTSPDSLIAWNPELKDKPVKKGQEIRIITRVRVPVPVVIAPVTVTRYDTVLHQIQDKETIWGLAKRYNTTVEQILDLNPELKDGLKTGYYVYIPVPVTGEKNAATTGAKSKGCENSRYKSKYKIALMIPLYLDEIDKIYISPSSDDQIKKPYFKSFVFVEFYQGLLIAIDSMKKAGLSLDLYVYDTANDTNLVKKILAKPEFPYMDMIIGPFFLPEYNLVAGYAARHIMKLVSPFARNPKLVEQNANVFQLNAASESKIAELARHIAKSWTDPNIILVMGNNDEDKALAKVFRSNLDAYAPNQSKKPPYAEVTYPEKGIAGVSTRFDATRPNIVVNLITGETMISNYVSNIAKLTKTFDITMFGMPEWRDYRTFDLEDLIAVNLHLFSNTFVDYDNPVTLNFMREYRDRYKGDPDDDHYGFLGYDLGLYFLKALYEYGLDFENCLDQMHYQPVATDFKWQQVKGKGYENIYLNLYKFSDYKQTPVRQAK